FFARQIVEVGGQHGDLVSALGERGADAFRRASAAAANRREFVIQNEDAHGQGDSSEEFTFGSDMADNTDGRNAAPGKLANRKTMRINTATVRLVAGVRPATRENKNVSESSCTP